jgi:hypothetical protein
MLPAREALIAKAQAKIMTNDTIDPIVKGIFYALVMETSIGVGDLPMIRLDQIARIDQWFRNPPATAKAITLLRSIGVATVEREFGQ